MRKKCHARSAEVVAALSRDPARGDVFWWLYDNYDEIRRTTPGRRIAWRVLQAKCVELGLKDGAGSSNPKTKALRRTFDRVRALKAREEAAATQQAVGRKRPAAPGPPPIAQPEPGARAVPAPTSRPIPRNEREAEAWAMLADLDATILRRSGRRVPQGEQS